MATSGDRIWRSLSFSCRFTQKPRANRSLTLPAPPDQGRYAAVLRWQAGRLAGRELDSSDTSDPSDTSDGGTAVRTRGTGTPRRFRPKGPTRGQSSDESDESDKSHESDSPAPDRFEAPPRYSSTTNFSAAVLAVATQSGRPTPPQNAPQTWSPFWLSIWRLACSSRSGWSM